MASRTVKPSALPRTPAIGREAFAAMSAVEGLTLAPAGHDRLEAQRARHLGPDERRAEVLRAYRSTGRRK